jgi:non-canonical purine NTP pyrophosphatase (RdgB/HAM1 family)
MKINQNSIVVVTGNKGKVAEISAILGRTLDNKNLDILDIQSLDVEEVARAKAQEAFKTIQRPVIVDDTGMSIDSLGGLPGALVAWFLDKLGPAGILKQMEGVDDRSASVSTAIGYADEDGVHVFLGVVRGSISERMAGENGFGYDPIFIPEGQNRTYAEMTSDEKNKVSMRQIALKKLANFLDTKG